MSFLQGLRENWGHKILRRKAKKVSRTKTYNNLDSAQTVGILFDASSKADIEDVKKLMTSLDKAGKRIDALGMVKSTSELALHADEVGFNFFAADECGFFCFPKDIFYRRRFP